MNKTLTLLGASAMALAVMSGGVEARKRTYEINGQKYTYDTRYKAQVAIARKRIEAANAAEAARTKAEAEKAGSPMVSIFGSPTQKEAAEAQARLQQVLAETEQPAETAVSSSEPSKPKEEARRERQDERPAESAEVEAKEKPSARERTRLARAPEAPSSSAPEANAQAAPKRVKSISYDVESGIKTIIRIDGSIEEEPFDSGTLARLLDESSGSDGLTDFVEKLRRSSAEDTTGSIPSPVAQPAPVSFANSTRR